MLCERIMNRDVKTLGEMDTAGVAARLMRDAAIGFVPVCNEEGRLVGAVTDRDIVLTIASDGGASLDVPLRSIMSRNVVACRPEDTLDRAELLMEHGRKSRIVCADEQGRPVGVISLADIAQHENGVRVARLLREITRREVR